MSKPRDRTVSWRSDGNWENKRNEASRASSVHATQSEAAKAARQMLKNQGGGELTTKGVDANQDPRQGHRTAREGPLSAQGLSGSAPFPAGLSLFRRQRTSCA